MKEKLTFRVQKNVFSEYAYYLWLIKLVLGILSKNKIDVYFPMMTEINRCHCSIVQGY